MTLNGAEQVTSTVAPLDAFTLVDVQVCRIDAGSNAYTPELYPFLDFGSIGITIDGTEVVPKDFPMRWLSQVLHEGNYRMADRRLALNCWGAGSRIEVSLSRVSTSAKYVAIFRYVSTPSEFLGIPYRYHLAKCSLDDLLRQSSPMHFAELQRETLRGAAVAAAVDWNIANYNPQIHANVPLRAKSSEHEYARIPIQGDAFVSLDWELDCAVLSKSLFDGLMVRVASTAVGTVDVPFGVARPSILQSLEDSLVRLTPSYESSVTVSITLPEGLYFYDAAGSDPAAVEFVSVIIERVKERNRK